MQIVKREGAWWIIGDPQRGIEDCGPYTTRIEAKDALREIKRFLKYENEPEFITSDSPRRKSTNGKTHNQPRRASPAKGSKAPGNS